ncbi:HMA domain-containing protein [Fusarium falciforme]|uniref:HMA domain-containing protein n=1 Tax=Fusarium falciforme TaxID=195108 RepID=UPI002300B286|nr:HMA domain-containing protein [Fusarium falciforme]WAO91618.1 HMA domain-containing protein [Fusarium falciforme]
MACCYIAAFCISQLVNACQFLDLENSIRYNEDKPELQYPERLRTADDQKVESNPIVLSLSGMTCSACSSSVEASLNSLPGVDRARVSLDLQQATIVENSPNFDREAIKNMVLDLRYGVEIGPRSPKEIIDVLRSKEEIARLKSSFSQLAQCATIIQLVSLLLSNLGENGYPHGWKWVRGGKPNMNTLISSSVSPGTAFSFLDLLIRGPVKATPYYCSVIELALVVVSGRYLETMSRRSAAEHLIRVYQPLLEDQYVKTYSTGQSFLRPGDEIVIESFSTIPCDCYITLGSASINQAIVTGESMPAKKSVGDFLLGGTQNMGEQLVCVVHKEQGSSFYAQLVQSAVEASGSKSEDFQFLDLMMNYFVIIVMSLAILAPLKDIYWSAHSLSDTFLRVAILRCMTILTCACPCALGLAIPSAVVSAANVAGQKGIATLDVSRFQTSKTWAHHTADFWTYICAIEEHTMSTHPLGRAIFSAGVAHLDDPWVEAKMDLCTEGVMVEPGMGISGDVSIASQPWQHVTIGSLRYLQSCGILDLPETPQETDRGVISVHIGIDYTYAGTLLVTDAVREDAKATMRQLDLMGCETKMVRD